MSDKFSYYTPENMQDKKLSDLKSDPAFLTDAVTFLKSNRKGYKPEDIKAHPRGLFHSYELNN